MIEYEVRVFTSLEPMEYFTPRRFANFDDAKKHTKVYREGRYQIIRHAKTIVEGYNVTKGEL